MLFTNDNIGNLFSLFSPLKQVTSLYYVIDNYMQELLREDIPQALRGQRNVIFGNIEKIHEFHQQHFCKELEM